MSDNVSITAGSGVTVGADEVTINGVSQKLQRIKLFDATDASTNAMVITTRGAAYVEGVTAHDAAAAANPLRIGVKARTTLSAVTLVASHDVTDVYGDLDGVPLVRPHTPLGAALFETVTCTTTAAAGFITFAATTLLRNYVTSIVVYNSGTTSTYVQLTNGAAGATLMRFPAPTKGFAACSFPVPLRQSSTNTALAYATGVKVASGVNVAIIGFQSKL